MRKIVLMGIGAALTAMAAMPVAANAQERVWTGAAIGAGTGAVIAGPPGAIVGGVAGAVIGGPRLSHRHARAGDCWRDSRGIRHCRSYR